ncbi:MAG: hypothetical protein O3A46_08875 [Candidatus Poribacteria bacterium]|nr:hypothetical protein [Candidatus Poribacteria bacterium]
MRQLKSGVYLADDFSAGLNRETWHVHQEDPAVTPRVEDGRLVIGGKTSASTHKTTSIVTQRPYPPDVVVMAEMRVPTDMNQSGTYGFSAHLRGHVGHGAAKGPDAGSDIAFGRYAGRSGWFHGWAERTRDLYLRRSDHGIGCEPFGDEAEAFRTVRIAYDAASHLLETAVFDGERWKSVGSTRRHLKQFTFIELKAESESSGVILNAEFRNLRLFPHPSRHPVQVIVRGVRGNVKVTLSPPDSDTVIAQSAPDDSSVARLWLPAGGTLAGHPRRQGVGRPPRRGGGTERYLSERRVQRDAWSFSYLDV